MKKVKNNIFFICFLTFSFASNGQEVDSLQIQVSSDWGIKSGWFGDEYIIMKPKIDPNAIGLSKAQKAREEELKRSGEERISFDKNGTLKYLNTLNKNVICIRPPEKTEPVLIRKLVSFSLKNGIVRTRYEKITRNGKTYSKGSANYEVLNWTEDSINLKKKNH